ncbi:hypothetical protein Nepgr_015678 [Nepenthes gracilis]|uniref:Uncharacterized protein n=1 Tax=Nepenthes gracilis TaxID=150966 RepID=A0AAD3SMI4_NEPGR|nr:hypothetical protein Nepgr_015678 [Nepenthes gracilis]
MLLPIEGSHMYSSGVEDFVVVIIVYFLGVWSSYWHGEELDCEVDHVAWGLGLELFHCLSFHEFGTQPGKRCPCALPIFLVWRVDLKDGPLDEELTNAWPIGRVDTLGRSQKGLAWSGSSQGGLGRRGLCHRAATGRRESTQSGSGGSRSDQRGSCCGVLPHAEEDQLRAD